MPSTLSISLSLKKAHIMLDNVRAKMEEVQEDIRDLEFGPEDVKLEDTYTNISYDIDEWLGQLYSMDEELLGWAGSKDDT